MSGIAKAAFTALGDPMRRELFERISESPKPVGRLAEGLPITRSAVSQHLRVLKEAGLVTDSPDGNRRIYRLDPRGIGALRHWLDQRWAAALTAFAAFADEQAEAEQETQSEQEKEE